MADLAARIRAVIDRDEAADEVRDYFSSTGKAYSGRHFEALSGGGDAPAVRDRFTADDLVAVQMLSVTVPPEVSYSILESSLSRSLSELLRQIPGDVLLGDPGAEVHVRNGSAAERAWSSLKAERGVGYVIAGKLMARKRPHLVPVYDDVVRCIFGEPSDVWLKMQSALSDIDVRARLEALRRSAAVPHVSLLRTLDVALWMSHHAEHQASKGRCEVLPGYGSTPEAR